MNSTESSPPASQARPAGPRLNSPRARTTHAPPSEGPSGNYAIVKCDPVKWAHGRVPKTRPNAILRHPAPRKNPALIAGSRFVPHHFAPRNGGRRPPFKVTHRVVALKIHTTLSKTNKTNRTSYALWPMGWEVASGKAHLRNTAGPPGTTTTTLCSRQHE